MDTIEQQQIRELFGELTADERAEFARRLESSGELRQLQKRYRALLERYREEGTEAPPAVDFDELLQPPAGRWYGRPGRAAWRAAAVLLVALAAFMLGRGGRSPEPQEASRTIEALAAETARLRQAVTLLAVQQERVSDRLLAVEELARLGQTNPSLAARSLLERLRDDPSVNVRLAALDVLYMAPELAPPAASLGGLLGGEPTIALRVALLDWIATARPPGWRALLGSALEGDESVRVRDRASELLEVQS